MHTYHNLKSHPSDPTTLDTLELAVRSYVRSHPNTLTPY